MQRTTSQPETTANRPPATRLVRGRRGRKPPLPSSRRNYQIHPPLFDTSVGDAETTSQPPATRFTERIGRRRRRCCELAGERLGFGFSLFGAAILNRRVYRKRRASVCVAVGPHHMRGRKMGTVRSESRGRGA
jgi:hypothetical protein